MSYEWSKSDKWYRMEFRELKSVTARTRISNYVSIDFHSSGDIDFHCLADFIF